jgi:hypothetical protein
MSSVCTRLNAPVACTRPIANSDRALPEGWLADHALAGRPAQIESRRRIGEQRRCGRSFEPRDDRVAGGIREVDVEACAGAVVRRERQPEQAAFATEATDAVRSKNGAGCRTSLRTTRIAPRGSTA